MPDSGSAGPLFVLEHRNGRWMIVAQYPYGEGIVSRGVERVLLGEALVEARRLRGDAVD